MKWFYTHFIDGIFGMLHWNNKTRLSFVHHKIAWYMVLGKFTLLYECANVIRSIFGMDVWHTIILSVSVCKCFQQRQILGMKSFMWCVYNMLNICRNLNKYQRSRWAFLDGNIYMHNSNIYAAVCVFTAHSYIYYYAALAIFVAAHKQTASRIFVLHSLLSIWPRLDNIFRHSFFFCYCLKMRNAGRVMRVEKEPTEEKMTTKWDDGMGLWNNRISGQRP